MHSQGRAVQGACKCWEGPCEQAQKSKSLGMRNSKVVGICRGLGWSMGSSNAGRPHVAVREGGGWPAAKAPGPSGSQGRCTASLSSPTPCVLSRFGPKANALLDKLATEFSVEDALEVKKVGGWVVVVRSGRVLYLGWGGWYMGGWLDIGV